MKNGLIYLHGKNGSADEAEHYRPLFPDWDVAGFDYRSATPWEAQAEFPAFFDRFRAAHEKVFLAANSIGAYFAMCALEGRDIAKAFFVSPIADMERLILDMLGWAGETEEQLREQRVIETAFGETLSWDYLCWVREHPVRWSVPTAILYGRQDQLQAPETIRAFSERISASLTVLEDGEHWFHTPAQMAFLDRWIQRECLLGSRILVLGCPGSGKSSFAKKLQTCTGLPLTHLDNIWWRPDRTHISREAFDRELETIMCGPCWILDGNYSRTYETRIRACDTVIFLDYDKETCMQGITERVGKPRDDMPWVEDALDPELVQLVQDYETENRPRVYALLAQYPEKRAIIFRTRQQAEDWLAEIRKE